jgi:hypothetical protein
VVSSRRACRAMHAALIGSRRGHDCVSVLHPIYNEEWTQKMLPIAAQNSTLCDPFFSVVVCLGSAVLWSSQAATVSNKCY